MVYEYMMKLHNIVAPILAIQNAIKWKSHVLKEVSKTLDNIHKWTNRYLEEPETPNKYWITTQNDKVQFCIRIQSRDELAKDVDRVLASYNHIISGLESVVEVQYGFRSIKEVVKVRK